MTTKKTTELDTGDRVTTPNGDRTGMVRRVHNGDQLSPPGQEREGRTVQFQSGSVQATDGKDLARPRAFVHAGDNAEWTVAD